jgi:hypothetical protein
MSPKPIAMIALAGALGTLLAASPVTATRQGLAVGTALAAHPGNGNGGGRGNGGAHGPSATASNIAGHHSTAPGGGRGKSLGRLQNDHDLDDMH